MIKVDSFKKIFVFLVFLTLVNVVAEAGEIEFKIVVPLLDIHYDQAGAAVLRIEGYSNSGVSGTDALPHRVFSIALPPCAVEQSINVECMIEEQIPLNVTTEVEKVPEIMKAGRIVNQENVGRTDAQQTNVAVLGVSRFRQVKLLGVDFHPVCRTGESGEMRFAKQANLRITFSENAGDFTYAHSGSGDLKNFCDNYEQAQKWYAKSGDADSEVMVSPRYDYIIITTQKIRDNCSELTSFKNLLQAEGHRVFVATEKYFQGIKGQAPNEWQDKIRKFLQNVYLKWGTEYVLFIGNPIKSEVPMKMCYPYGAESDPCPTDYYYADLTGNWDRDGDLHYGEYGDDFGIRGVDFVPEVYVGRIPVYFDNYESVNNILRKIMDYRNPETSKAWRKKVLLPEAFISLENQNGSGLPRTDGAQLAEEMIQGFLGNPMFTVFRLYEKDGLQPSLFECQAPLTLENVVSEWSTGYGLTVWDGHGNNTGAYRLNWAWDDGDSIPEDAELGGGEFFSRYECTSLDNTKPAIVYQSSCGNGTPEDCLNLGYTLLKNGGIATVSATRFAIVYIGEQNYCKNPTEGGIGYRFAELVAGGVPVGKALYQAKGNPEIWFNVNWAWHNYMTMNLYGEPGTSLLD